MTPLSAFELSTSFLAPLLTAAARALVLGSAAGLGNVIFRVKTTSVRLFIWTTVLYAACAMPLLERMLPSLPLPAPAFLQHGAAQSAANDFQSVQHTVTPIKLLLTSTSPVVVNSSTPTSSVWHAIQWSAVAAGIYLVIAFFLLVRFFVGLALGNRLRSRSQRILEPRIAARLASGSRAAGLSFIPQAAESEFIAVPITMGVLRPVILLPASWREWDDTKLDAVIAHELSHVARRDTLTQRVSFLHCAIFWFSPFAWWLNRHLADLAEQASDEAALSCGADRTAYARTLLSFFEDLQSESGRVRWQGVSMATAGRAEQRVEKILAWKETVTMNLKKSVAVMVVAFAVPVVYLTASAHPADNKVSAQTSQTVELAQEQAPTAPATAPQTPRAAKKASSHSFYSYGGDDAQRFVIVSGNSDSLTMSGTRDDGAHVEELRKTIQGDFIWFARGDKSYIIRDQATFDRAKAFWAPQDELGKKQEELGKQQEALGKQQEELGSKMEQVRVKVPDLTKEMEKLQAELKQLNSTATVEQIGEIQSEIGDLQSKIGDTQSQASDQQSKLGDEMGVLGEEQGKLGEQQGELGRQQGELAEQASRQMKQLLDDAIAKGTAQLEL
jgi:beta-lactamase regulating signal transducer with metallopeptidase domain